MEISEHLLGHLTSIQKMEIREHLVHDLTSVQKMEIINFYWDI